MMDVSGALGDLPYKTFEKENGHLCTEEGALVCYTDGSCLLNGTDYAVGGYAVFSGSYYESGAYDKKCLECEKIGLDNRWIRNPNGPCSNQACELYAIFAACFFANEQGVKDLVIRTDSQHAIDCITKFSKNWLRRYGNGKWFNRFGKKVKNQYYIKEILRLTNEMNVTYQHVGRNSGDFGIECCDRMAKEVSRADHDRQYGVGGP